MSQTRIVGEVCHVPHHFAGGGFHGESCFGHFSGKSGTLRAVFGGISHIQQGVTSPMSTTKRPYWTTLIGCSAILLAGCAPSDSGEDTTPAGDAPDVTAVAEPSAAGDILPPDSMGEGSEPKAEPFAGGEVAAAEGEEAVDTSIRDATEYGDDALVQGLEPEGWAQTGSIEHYNVASLYTKIDGRSELYMAYDVRGLSWVSMIQDGNRDNFLDVFIYDMQSTSGSFGVYSVEREEGQEQVDVGADDAYKSGSNYYMRKGKYYAYINASQENEGNDAAGLAVATALMARVPEDDSPVRGLDWLPTDGLIEDSIAYFKVDAMSLDFLSDTFLASYDFGQGRVRAFISKRENVADAAAIYEAFKAYGNDYGDSVELMEVSFTECAFTDWGGGYYDVVAAKGATIVGLTNVEGKENAVTAMTQLLARVN